MFGGQMLDGIGGYEDVAVFWSRGLPQELISDHALVAWIIAVTLKESRWADVTVDPTFDFREFGENGLGHGSTPTSKLNHRLSFGVNGGQEPTKVSGVDEMPVLVGVGYHDRVRVGLML